MLEVLEREIIDDLEEFRDVIDEHRASGLQFAIDDFGSGHAGLSMLANFQPDFVKIDMGLLRDIDRSGPRQAIVRGILRTCSDLGVEVIAEGIESEGEYRWLSGEGVHLFQGYLVGKPAFEQLSGPVEFSS
jgi:EAL domain-containing protein (putative c-di-GMP-specific phosphodiesterase class I)